MSQSNGPALKRGWMKKYSRSGLIKNWQNRYFVLNQGKIAYYQNQSDRFPYGDEFKGELGLFQASVSTDSKKVLNEKQIYICGANGEKDLLLELENVAEIDSWIRAIREHIDYANRRGSFIDPSNDSLASSSPKTSSLTSRHRSASAAEFPVTPAPGFVIKVLRQNGEKVFVNLCEAAEVPMINASMGYNKWPFMILTPVRNILEEKENGQGSEISVYDAIVNPAVLVICAKNPEAKDATCARVLRLLKKQHGENLQEEYKLPKIAKRYKGEIQTVYVPVDIQQLSKTRSSIHVRTMQERKPSSNSNDSTVVPPLSRQMSTPLPSNDHSFSGKTPSFQQQHISRQNTEPITSSSSSPMNDATSHSRPTMGSRVKSINNASSTYSGAAFLRRKSETEQPYQQQHHQQQQQYHGTTNRDSMGNVSPVSKLFPAVSDTVPTRGESLSNTNNIVDNSNINNVSINPNRWVIPYIIIRANGASARTRPEKLSQSKNLGYNTRVFVNARRFLLPEKIAWLRTTDGWITERVYAGSMHRVLQPVMHGQPLRAKIVTTRFEDVGGSHLRSSYGGRNTTVSTSGWFGFRDSAIHEPFQTRFAIDLYFADNAMIRISRTLAEFLMMRQQLLSFPDKMIQDRAMKAGEIYCLSDGEEQLVLDVHYLLEVVEGVETWLCRLLATLPVDKCKCKALVDFLSPKEIDMEVMEGMLSCKNGLNGAWPEVEQDLESLENSIQE